MSKTSIKVNYIFNTAYQILILIVPIITTPYISRVLGAEGIGTYSYSYSIVSYFLLFANMGTATYGQRTIAYYQENIEKRSISFFEIFIFRLITSLISIFTYIVYVVNVENINKVVALIQTIYLISIIFDVTWFFQGMEEFKKIVIRNGIIKIIDVILIFTFVKTTKDVGIYTLILATMTFIANISVWIYLPRFICKVSIKLIRPFKNFKDIFLLFIPTIAVQLYTVLDKTMIGGFAIGGSENGYYEQTDKIVRMALAIVTSLGTVMIPRIAKVFAEENYEIMKKYIQKSYQFIWFLGIPLMFGLIGISKVFVPVFFGNGYNKILILLPIYSMIIIPVSLSNVTGLQFLIPTKRQNVYTVAVSLSALLNIILNAFLIPRFLSIGAAIASVLAELIGAIIMLYYVQVKKQIEIKDILRKSYKNWVAGICMLVIVSFASNFFRPNVLSLCMLISLGGMVYFIVLVILKEEFFLDNTAVILRKIKSKGGKK